MTHLARIIAGLGFAAGLFVVQMATVRTDQTPPVNVPGIDKPVIVVTREIRGNETWTNGNYYVLRGHVFVREGSTLTIQAGTRVIGEAGSLGTLVVERGARINAIGTATDPIVFTSDQPVGERSRGDWGGIIINGRAPINIPGGEGEGEADTGLYGGNDPDDNSGTIRYVRVEFAGAEVSPDNELNGIAFQGVGRGTTVDHVQIHMNRDDGLEWFGGTVDVKYALVSNAADDSFDWTQGWIGRAQFVAIHQRSDDGQWGIEADNNEANHNFLPRANPQIYNMTICGDLEATEGTEAQLGALFRRGTSVTFNNFLVRTRSNGLRIDDGATMQQVANGSIQVGSGVVWGSSAANALHSSVTGFVSSGRFPNVRVAVDGGLSPDCSRHENPNFQPTSVATLAGGQLAPVLPPNDGFFEVTTFIGAVPPPPAADWTQGWTSYPQR
jgi:hypothetical protein